VENTLYCQLNPEKVCIAVFMTMAAFGHSNTLLRPGSTPYVERLDLSCNQVGLLDVQPLQVVIAFQASA
jgi:hypothetical protein